MHFETELPLDRRTKRRIRETRDKFNHTHELIERFDDVSFTRKLYDLWSNDYDRDMQVLRYRAPEYIAAFLKYDLEVGLDAKILDLGCGTGLVGKELKQLQFVDVHGVDISPHMIIRAKRKDCYTSCRVIDDLSAIDDCFDVVILCSAFGRGHIAINNVDLLIPLTKSTAHMVVAQLSSQENLENKPLQEFVEILATRLNAQPPRIEPIERYVSGRIGLVGIVST